MVLTSDVQAFLVDMVGDTPDGKLAARVSLFWDRNTSRALTHPRLQELYTYLDLIELKLGWLNDQVDFVADAQLEVHLSDRQKYLHTKRSEVKAEIEKFESIARGNRVPANTSLTRLTPEPAPSGRLPASDPSLVGDPYTPGFRRKIS